MVQKVNVCVLSPSLVWKSRENLIQEQKEDPEFRDFYQHLEDAVWIGRLNAAILENGTSFLY